MEMIIKEPPGHWKEEKNPIGFSRAFSHKIDGLFVLRSLSKTKDGEEWIHVSVSRKSRTPSWDDMAKVKQDFIGEEYEAYQVMPKSEDYVNVHSHCLHIWCPLDQKRRVCNLMDLVWEESK